jgi:hypothetical protein
MASLSPQYREGMAAWRPGQKPQNPYADDQPENWRAAEWRYGWEYMQDKHVRNIAYTTTPAKWSE